MLDFTFLDDVNLRQKGENLEENILLMGFSSYVALLISVAPSSPLVAAGEAYRRAALQLSRHHRCRWRVRKIPTFFLSSFRLQQNLICLEKRDVV